MTSLSSMGQDQNSGERCRDQCAPSPSGCLRCQTVPAGDKTGSDSALLFGPKDLDAREILWQALVSNGLELTDYGPLLALTNVRDRLSEIAGILKTHLSAYTQSCIQAAFMPSGLNSSSDALSAMIFATPLSQVIENIEHEWVRTALSESWLFSVFHPIIHSRSGEVYGNEALLRARNPQSDKVMGAGQIIQACEKLKLQHQLDQQARKAAIHGAAEHLPGSSRIFINFLPNTIYDPEICLRTTMEAAAECDLPMSRLVFEVVETEKIPDMDHLCKVLDYYRNRGVGTAIDDMGAGFTGLDYISSLQPDFVKLDREFVLEAERTNEGRRAMDAIIAASHVQGSRVIAEGIETVAQMMLCRNAGVDFLQGFLFAKPACPPQQVSFPMGKREAA